MKDILLLGFVVVAVGNLLGVVSHYCTGRSFSTIPFIGGLCGAVALWLRGSPAAHWCWVPLFADLGCLPLVLRLAWSRIRPPGHLPPAPLEGNAEAPLEAEVLDFVCEQTGVPRNDVGLASGLRLDLGVDGDDGAQFLEAFGSRFSVDLTTCRPQRHFGPEGVGPADPAVAWSRLLRGRRLPPLIEITVSDLVRAAEGKRWDCAYDPDIAHRKSESI